MRPSQAFDTFEALSYPSTTGELVDEIGATELRLPNGTETIREVFARLDADTYADPWDAYTMFLSALTTAAIGRKAYSDRDPPVFGIGDVDSRARDPLLEDESRFDAPGPHCGVCRHMKRVGDWDVVAYCQLREETVEPTVGDVCSDYASLGRS